MNLTKRTTEQDEMNKYVSIDGKVEITVRQIGRHQTAWALHIEGQYRGSKVLPSNNTAIVQNFGYEADKFNRV